MSKWMTSALVHASMAEPSPSFARKGQQILTSLPVVFQSILKGGEEKSTATVAKTQSRDVITHQNLLW